VIRAMPLAFSDQASMYFYGVLTATSGLYFILHGFRRELRQRRCDPEAEPVVRSDRVDRVVQIACFVLGGLFAGGGLLIIGATFLAQR
jgi:hypothetical protein